MKNTVIPLILIMLVVALSGCIQSDLSKINGLSSTINDHLKKGDDYYNNAASDLNKYSLDSATTNCNNAITEFNSSKNSAQEALNYAQATKDTVFVGYMQNLMVEIDSKLNATLELKQAIPYFQQKNNNTGNPHVQLANQFMDKAMEYKDKKNSIVKQNPTKFK
ncbi:MAG: hypothetical protein HZC47_08375 [Methanobacterium sp.]|uniref:hypothetical protein n=1 Tax=Methanobacterium sp. TaxID=2164 RepID=UPI003D65D7E4|nr:hypothetical protein [Methanobacterium sp.]